MAGAAHFANAAFQDVINNRYFNLHNAVMQGGLGAGFGRAGSAARYGVAKAFGTTPQGNLHGANAFAFGFSMFSINVQMQAFSSIASHGVSTALSNVPSFSVNTFTLTSTFTTASTFGTVNTFAPANTFGMVNTFTPVNTFGTTNTFTPVPAVATNSFLTPNWSQTQSNIFAMHQHSPLGMPMFSLW